MFETGANDVMRGRRGERRAADSPSSPVVREGRSGSATDRGRTGWTGNRRLGGTRLMIHFDVRHDLPGDVRGGGRPRHHAARAGGRALRASRRGIRGISRPTTTARSTTGPTAAGPGMVMLPEPLETAIEAAQARQRTPGSSGPQVVLLSPQGEVLDRRAGDGTRTARRAWCWCAGRYEGGGRAARCGASIDEEVSIGDYVLSGGELPAMVLIDCHREAAAGRLDDAESRGAGLVR